MDRGHDGMQGTSYSPLGLVVRFPVRGTSLCASLGCGPAPPTRPQGSDARRCVHHFSRVERTTLQRAFSRQVKPTTLQTPSSCPSLGCAGPAPAPTRPQGSDARTCVHHFSRRVERTTLQRAGAKTPRLTFIGRQLAATEQQQGEKSPPHPLPAPPPSFSSIGSTSEMSQGNFTDNDDVDDAFLAELMSTDIDVGEEEGAAAAAACTLPVLGNIWECSMLRKLVTTDDSGKEFSGWSCGWCMKRDDVPFRGVNASKALWHVLKEAGHDIRPCRGHIPKNKVAQYRQLANSKAQAKDLRVRKKSTLTTTIGDLQDRTAISMTAAGRAMELVHCFYCFMLLFLSVTLLTFSLPPSVLQVIISCEHQRMKKWWDWVDHSCQPRTTPLLLQRISKLGRMSPKPRV